MATIQQVCSSPYIFKITLWSLYHLPAVVSENLCLDLMCGKHFPFDIPKRNNRKMANRVIVATIRQDDAKQSHDFVRSSEVCLLQRPTEVRGPRLGPTAIDGDIRHEITW